MNSENLLNDCSMNWVQFKDATSHMCLAGAAIASWSLTHKKIENSHFSHRLYPKIDSTKTFIGNDE